MPKVSVLVPIFNVEKYLRECLDSVVNQTLQDIEIICINDGSTDSSLSIIKEYSKKDPRIILIDKKNSGYGDSMNKGLKKASGDYIGIVESDDWIEPTAFEELYDLTQAGEVEVVKSNFYNYFTNPNKAAINGTITQLVNSAETGRVIDPRYNHQILYQRPAIWTGLYKRSFLEENAIKFLASPGASYQDTGFNFKVWSVARKAVFTEKAFLHYRQDNESSSVNSPGKTFCVSDEYKEIEKYLKKNGLTDTFKELVRVTKWGAYAWNINRLTGDLAKDFILKASEEYRKDYLSGDFNYELCDPNQVRSISELIHTPEKTIARKYAAEKAKISVIIPAFNVERYAEKSIYSALNQTLQDIEVIIVDDGSTDETPDIIENIFRDDVRVKFINTANSGQAAARNVGIDNARAPYIAFLDADDYYEKDSLAHLYESITSTDSDLSVGSINIIYKDKRYTAIQKNQDKQYYMVKFRDKHLITPAVMKKTDVSPCNKLFRRDLIEEFCLRFPSGLRYEDAYLFNTYAMMSKYISFVPQDIYVYNYVRRSDSTMAETFTGVSPLAYDHLEIAIHIYDFMVVNKLVQSYGDYFIDLFVDYFNFAVRWSPEDVRSRIYERTIGFIGHNKASLSLINDKAINRLEELVPTAMQTNNEGSLQPRSIFKRASRVAKNAIRPLLPKMSVSYRTHRYTVDGLKNLEDRINHIERQQLESEKRLSTKIENLEHIISNK